MFRPLSPFDMVQRVDVTVDDGVLASGLIGSWVTIYTGSEGYKVGAQNTQKARFATTSYAPVYVIWTEGNKRGSTVGSNPSTNPGFTPDALYTKKLTTLVGKWRALTDMVTSSAGTKVPGAYLMPDTSSTSGKLKECPVSTLNFAATGVIGGTAPGTFYAWSGGIPCAVVRNYHTWLEHMGVTYSGVWEIENLV